MRKKIKCSQCNKTFYNGEEYRIHFLDNHLKGLSDKELYQFKKATRNV